MEGKMASSLYEKKLFLMKERANGEITSAGLVLPASQADEMRKQLNIANAALKFTSNQTSPARIVRFFVKEADIEVTLPMTKLPVAIREPQQKNRFRGKDERD